MKNRFMITLKKNNSPGYGAPKSDVIAIDLMKQGWEQVRTKLEQLKLSNVSSEDSFVRFGSFIHLITTTYQ